MSSFALGLSPFESLLSSQGFIVLDGGLATELEARGHDLDHPLWSARTLIEDPERILDVHLEYLRAGADCVIGAAYQASPRGLREAGYSDDETRRILHLSVDVAAEARRRFLAEKPAHERARPLVAAGLGPFGAYLADGSEFRGRYGVSRQELWDFHAERLDMLWQAGPDLIAVETLPDFDELAVLLELLGHLGAPAWISFSCADGRHLNDGTPIRTAAAACAEHEEIVAVGINCTAPRFVDDLIPEIRRAAPSKTVLVYPNSGETYNGATRSWTGKSDPDDFGNAAVRWHGLGADGIGGCCRSRPAHIRAVRQALKGAQVSLEKPS